MAAEDGQGTVRPADAVDALRARGVDDAESFLDTATPEVIVATCRWWDGQRNAKKGLLVWKLRQGGATEAAPPRAPQTKRAQLAATFAEYAERFPVGAAAEPHVRMQQRRWPGEDPCPGSLIVIGAAHPVIEVRCDACAFEAAYSISALGTLPARPSATGRPEPPVAKAQAYRSPPPTRHERPPRQLATSFPALTEMLSPEAAQPSRSRRHAPTPGVETSQGRCSAAPPGRSDERGEEQS